MKEASEEELGLNLTVRRVGAGRRASAEARWILDPRTAPGAGCGAMRWEALRVSFFKVPGTHAFPTPCVLPEGTGNHLHQHRVSWRGLRVFPAQML